MQTDSEQYSSALWLLSSHSLEDGGLRFTVRRGALFICLQLLDWKLRQPGKPCTISGTAEAWLLFPGCIFARYCLWRDILASFHRCCQSVSAGVWSPWCLRFTWSSQEIMHRCEKWLLDEYCSDNPSFEVCVRGRAIRGRLGTSPAEYNEFKCVHQFAKKSLISRCVCVCETRGCFGKLDFGLLAGLL